MHEGDREAQLVLRCAAIISHTAMAVLLRTLSQALSAGQGNPAAPPKDQAPPIVYRRRCRKSLKDAIKMTKEFDDGDYPFIEVTMQVCLLSSLWCFPFVPLTVLFPAGLLVPDLCDDYGVGQWGSALRGNRLCLPSRPL